MTRAASLVLEAREHLGVTSGLGVHQLEGETTTQLLVHDLEHHAHPALAEHADHPIPIGQ
jgi:hypothetical protein